MNVVRRMGAVVFLAFSASSVVAADEPKSSPELAEVQRHFGLDPKTPLESRVKETSATVLVMFKEFGGPPPRTHELTDRERLGLKSAIDALPPLHRRVLTERLRSINFLDGMPNTALTSTVNRDETVNKLFDITVNASILGQNASEWLTQKEQSCFDAAGSPLTVMIDAGTKLDAIVYVLMHEATHVVDATLHVTPDMSRKPGDTQPAKPPPATPFTEGVWEALTKPVPRFRDAYRGRVGFYKSGGKIKVAEAPDVYQSLRKTPFVSLYGSLNWTDDLAEYVAVYQWTEVLKQPFRIVVRDEGREVLVDEPMKSDLTRKRVGQMMRFYE